MEFGICHLNCVAIRKDPSDQSEMISQLLFGDMFQVIDTTESWVRIHTDYDYYEGWVQKIQVKTLDEDVHGRLLKNNDHYSGEMVTMISDKDDHLQIISLGASLPLYREELRFLSRIPSWSNRWMRRPISARSGCSRKKVESRIMPSTSTGP